MKKLVVANWKMNPVSKGEALKLFKETGKISKNLKGAGVVVCAPFLYIPLLKKSKNISIGAQNVSSWQGGAYTGQVSASMLRSLGVSYSIVGHSEVRQGGETNELINKKIKLLMKEKISVILCVGESERDHHGSYLAFIRGQIKECLYGISKTQIKNVSIAYEPIWAIGKDAVREATADEFTEVFISIKRTLSDIYDKKTTLNLKVLYGGSVHPENVSEFKNADGFLVGRDSLDPKKFKAILQNIR